jgi:hypothetical protein
MGADFKTCPSCSTRWSSREEFLTDNHLDLVGYQVNSDELELGLFLFNHRACKTTLAIRAEQLQNLYIGPVFNKRRTGKKDCPGYCLRPMELAMCATECECAWVRGLLQLIRHWPKVDREVRASVG